MLVEELLLLIQAVHFLAAAVVVHQQPALMVLAVQVVQILFKLVTVETELLIRFQALQ
jgi:hypothetical protein